MQKGFFVFYRFPFIITEPIPVAMPDAAKANIPEAIISCPANKAFCDIWLLNKVPPATPAIIPITDKIEKSLQGSGSGCGGTGKRHQPGNFVPHQPIAK